MGRPLPTTPLHNGDGIGGGVWHGGVTHGRRAFLQTERQGTECNYNRLSIPDGYSSM